MAMKPPALDDAVIDEMCHLREERDLTYAQIARRLGVTLNQVRWHVRTRGAYGPRDLEAIARRRKPQETIMRRGRPVRPFSPEESARAIALLVETGSSSKVARMLGRAKSSVRAHAAGVARRQEILAGDL